MQQNLIELFNRYKAGDEEAFCSLYEVSSPYIWSFIRKRVHRSKQEDCFQQFWLHLHSKKNLYHGQPLLPWMYVILRNLIIDDFRAQRQVIYFEQNDEASELREELAELLSELTTQDKELIERIYIQGFTYEDLAKEWGLSQTSLRKRLSRGIGSLAKKFGDSK